MDEYIKREQAIRFAGYSAAAAHKRGGLDACSALEKFKGTLRRIPAADVAPVVHGRWLNFYNDFSCAECDRCGTTFEVTDSESNEGLWNAFKLSYNYCPNCGAKMDEEG